MKKKITILTVIAFLIGGGITYATSSNYYANLLDEQQADMADELKFYYTDNQNAEGSGSHDELMEYANQQEAELRDRMIEYLHEKMNENQGVNVEDQKEVIDNKITEMEKELKEQIDNLVK